MEQKFNKKINSLLIPSILLFLSLSLSVYYLYNGIGMMTDQFYWLKLIDNLELKPMTIGTLYIGKIWGFIFGTNLLSYRWLKWILEIGAMLFIFFSAKNVNIKDRLYALSILILLAGSGWQNEFSPTVVTNFFLCLQFYTCIRFSNTKHNKLLLIGILSIITALTILVRFPNIISILIISIFICLLNFKANYIYSILYIITSMIIYYLSLCVIYECTNPFVFLFPSISNTANGSHSLNSLINGYLWDFNIFFSLICVSFFFIHISTKGIELCRNVVAKYVVNITLFLFFCFYFLKSIGFHKWNNTMLILFLAAFAIAIILYMIYDEIKKRRFSQVILLLFIFTLSLISTAGSDTRYLKLFPILLYFIYPYIKTIYIKHNAVLYAIILCTLTCYIANPLTLSCQYTLFDKKVYSKSELMSNIALVECENQIVDEIMYDTQLNDKSKIVFGNVSCFVSYISGDKIKLGAYDYRQNFNDSIFVKKCITQSTNYDEIYVCDEDLDKDNLFSDYLSNNGYKKSKTTFLYNVYNKIQ